MEPTTALRRIARLKKKIKVIQGGQGAGKTISILIILINHASSQPNKEIIIASAELTKMRLTVIKDFVKVMKSFGIYSEVNFLAGTLYRFPNGSFIKFIGLDKEDIGKGLRGDVFYLNEGDKVNFETYREVASRFKHIYIDFNPNTKFWAHDEVIVRSDCDYLNLTFLDNEFLDQGEVDEILLYFEKGYGIKWTPDLKREDYPEPISKYWANKWRVYGLGEIGRLQEAVYPRWWIIDSKPERFTKFVYGLDFGFQHPTALIRVWYWEDELFVEEVVYETGLTSGALIERLKSKGVEYDKEIMCDYARPEMINDLANAGFYCLNADKSVEKGINFINEMKVYVHKDSVNIQRENRMYKRKTIGGQITEHIDKKNDDAMDAIRYAGAEIKEAHYSGAMYSSF